MNTNRANYRHPQEQGILEAERQIAMDTSFNTMINRTTSLNEDQARRIHEEWMRNNIPQGATALRIGYQNRIDSYINEARLHNERTFSEILNEAVSLYHEEQTRGICEEWIQENVPRELQEKYSDRMEKHFSENYW
jgi:hypothetical protein